MQSTPWAPARGDFGWCPAVQAEAPVLWEGALASPRSCYQRYPPWHPGTLLGVTVLPSPGSVRAVPVGCLQPKVIEQLCRQDRL